MGAGPAKASKGGQPTDTTQRPSRSAGHLSTRPLSGSHLQVATAIQFPFSKRLRLDRGFADLGLQGSEEGLQRDPA